MANSRIISLIDGSIYSQSVCHHSAWAANKLGASVELMHVLGRREASSSGDLSGTIALGARTALLDKLADLDAERGKLLQERGRAIIDDARKILTDAGIEKIEARMWTGDLIELLAGREPNADIVVVGKRGEAADFATLHLGSNLERIVRASHKPVLVASRAFSPIRKVLIAWDSGASSEKAVNHVASSPLFADCQIHMVFVGRETAEITGGLANASTMLATAGRKAAKTVLPGQPEKVLGEFIASEGFDMLVMGAYGHSRIRNLIIGSTTTEMIRTCRVPVMLMR